MKIALVCNQGGHLTEILFLMKAFENHDVFFVTYNHPTTKKLKHRKYLIKNYINANILQLIIAFFEALIILIKEKPDIVISTGAEIAIPIFILSRIFKIKTIYIASWCRVTSPGSGQLIYPFSNVFLVQWPQVLKEFGKKAMYKGAVI